MFNKKRRVSFVLVGVLVLSMILGGCSGNTDNGAAAEDEVLTIKVGHGAPETNAMHAGWVKFEELVEAKSEGKIDVVIYSNGQLGGDRELIESLQLGNVHMTSPSSAPLASFSKQFFVLDIPFLFSGREQAYAALDGEAGDALLGSLEEFSIKGLTFFENGFRNLTNSKVAVRTPDDLAGLKIRTMENEIHLSAWTKLGANPTPMAFGELFTALQQKTVDGQENPFELIYNVKFHEVQDYITKTQHIYSPYVTIINKDFYEGLSDENRAIIDEAIKEATDHQRSVAMENDINSEQLIKDAGVEVIELSADEKGAFKGLLSEVFDEVKVKAGEEIVQKFIDATK